MDYPGLVVIPMLITGGGDLADDLRVPGAALRRCRPRATDPRRCARFTRQSAGRDACQAPCPPRRRSPGSSLQLSPARRAPLPAGLVDVAPLARVLAPHRRPLGPTPLPARRTR